jgi:circadian clock protein KaiB
MDVDTHQEAHHMTPEEGDAPERYVLRLYVAGMTPRAGRAIEHVRAVCDEHLYGRFELAVVDIYQQPALAKGEQIIAAPTLIKELPPPLRRIIGDMSDHDRLLVGLDLAGNGRR